MKKTFPALTIFFLLIIHITPAQAGFLPFGRMYKAAQDERAYTTQAKDTRLQLQLHKAIILNEPSDLMSISTYVYLEHGFLVGEVSNEEQSKKLVSSAAKLSQLNGISYYLPLKNKESNTETSSALEIKIKAMFEPDYPSSKLTVKVVQDVVVVLGVLSTDEQQKALNSLKKFSRVAKVINFIQIPSVDQRKRIRKGPIRNLLN